MNTLSDLRHFAAGLLPAFSCPLDRADGLAVGCCRLAVFLGAVLPRHVLHTPFCCKSYELHCCAGGDLDGMPGLLGCGCQRVHSHEKADSEPAGSCCCFIIQLVKAHYLYLE